MNICTDFPDTPTSWDREIAQRNSSVEKLLSVSNDDIIFTSDVDEIPNFQNIDFALLTDENSLICHQDFYYYYFNTMFQELDKPKNFWQGSRIVKGSVIKNYTIDQLRNPNSAFNITNKEINIHLPNAGWHFSFLGGAEKIKYKIQAYSHQEFNNPIIHDNISKNLSELLDPFYRKNCKIYPVEMTYETHPSYLMDNLDKYTEYIYKG